MPYSLSKKQKYVHINWSGIITTNDLRSIGKDLTAVMTETGRAPNVLHTFEKVEAMDFGPWAMFIHSIRRQDTKLPNKAKSAQVAKSDKTRTVCKMFRDLNRNPNIEMQVFNSEAEALDWLMS